MLPKHPYFGPGDNVESVLEYSERKLTLFIICILTLLVNCIIA